MNNNKKKVMDSKAQNNKQLGAVELYSDPNLLIPTSELSKKHFTNEEAACDENIANLGLPLFRLTFKEVTQPPNADSLVAIKSGVFAVKSSNTFDLKLDEIFHNYNKKMSLEHAKDDECDTENAQIPIAQSLKRTKAILDFKTSPTEKSPPVKNVFKSKKQTKLPRLRMNKKISKCTEKFLDKGIQVKILPSKIMMHQFEISENLKLSKMSKCHERHCNLGACRCMRLTKHVRHVSYPRGPCCHFRLLKKLSIAIKAVNKLKAKLDVQRELRAAFLNDISLL